MRKATLVIVQMIVAVSLLTSFLFVFGVHTIVQAEAPAGNIHVTHSAIRVNDDSELSALAVAEGWMGVGTNSDPFKIQNLEIDGKGSGTVIYIGNTTSYLVIQDCRLYGGVSTNEYHYTGAGIMLRNVENVVVKENDCSGNFLSIRLTTSRNCTVENNTCNRNLLFGIFLERSNNIIVSGNECNNNSQHGIEINKSFKCEVRNNTCSDNEYFCIRVYISVNISIRNNSFNNSWMFGIYLIQSDFNTIENNIISSNSQYGINLEYSNNNRVIGNALINNNVGGRHDSPLKQAQDLGGNNTWNTTSSGNYWSEWTGPDTNIDGIVDVPHPIHASDNKDYYPLVSSSLVDMSGSINSFETNVLITMTTLVMAALLIMGLVHWQRKPEIS